MITSAQIKFPSGKTIRNPTYSRHHPIIPQLTVSAWQTDMKNRKLILKNANEGLIPHYEHDENLYLCKREQMSYNVEDRDRVNAKYSLPSRTALLHPNFSNHSSRFNGTLMQMRDDPNEYAIQQAENSHAAKVHFEQEQLA